MLFDIHNYFTILKNGSYGASLTILYSGVNQGASFSWYLFLISIKMTDAGNEIAYEITM